MKTVTLNNGVKMPIEGFGVFQIPDAKQCEEAVLSALAAGYRHIDTAAAYGNEEAVGAAIAKSGIPREELFITTKLWIQDYGYESCRKAFELSLKKLGLSYLDLYLIHQPFSDYYASWRAMEKLYEEGLVRVIGVCNFYPERLADFCLNVSVIPAVNQIECHPFFQRKADRSTLDEFGVKKEAWGPLAEGGHNIFHHPVLEGIAKKYHKSVARVVLRWHVQNDVIIIPKSVNKNRIKENFDIWDFELSADDMCAIEALDTGHSDIIDHFSPDTAKYLNGFKIHE